MQTLEKASVKTRCYRCGSVVGTAEVCQKCGTAQPKVPVKGHVDLDIDLRFDPPVVSARYKTNPHYLLALLACLFFLPVGLVAMFKASQAETRIKNGDYTGAMKSSESAESLARFAIFCGVLVTVASVLMAVGFART